MSAVRKWLIVMGAFVSACTPNQTILNDSAERQNRSTPSDISSTPEQVGTDADIAAMRTADFNFIYVFRRNDGGVLDGEDRSFMNANTPYEINRRKLSDGGRALVVGSNFRFPPENFRAMKERFAFEDHSKPETELHVANANSNSGK